MPVQKIIYIIRESIRNLRTNPMVSAISTGIIALSILIFGMFLVIFMNFAGLFEQWGRRVAVDAYLVMGADEDLIEAVRGSLESIAEVDKIEFVSAEEAREQFRDMLGPQEDMLDELGENPLPASFRAIPVKAARSPEALENLAAKIAGIEGVDEVRYGARWVARFEAVISILRMLGLVIGAILLLASVLIISNTIRLTVFSRKEEIEIMRLVGATEMLIRVPFFLSGLLQGFTAGIIAVALLWMLYHTIMINIRIPLGAFGLGQLVFLPAWAMAALVFGGAALGMLGSSVALSRFMD